MYLIILHFEVSFTQNFTPAFCEHHCKAAVRKLKGHLYMISSHSFIIEQNSRLNVFKKLHECVHACFMSKEFIKVRSSHREIANRPVILERSFQSFP